ncbi:MAG: 4a-hydroxytetrahydrobiopterin dehydratase [Planctomycetes bacterium]|nr:4a-hydroxytetrahydrobiopterin dehydratase [Planctomycetota bacterium]
MSELLEKRCAPCEGGVPPLSPTDARRMLPQIPGWELREDGKELRRTLAFKNYHEVMAFVNAVAWIAYRENHHPDLEVGFRKVLVRYSTHAIQGLSENDFICAAKVNQLLAS